MWTPPSGLRQAGAEDAGTVAGGRLQSEIGDLVPLTFAVSAAFVLVGSLLAVAAPYSLDEAVYLLMAEAARDGGRLSINNGYQFYPSDALRIVFLREGPLGLVPQYPSGYGFLALPFYIVAGARGLIVMNSLAYLAAMAATYMLARQLEASRYTALTAALIFGFGTFAVAYAVGIWPHAVAVAIVAGSALSIVVATRPDRGNQGLVFALMGGLLAGFGTTIRVDVILLVPPVLLWLMAQREHWRHAAVYVAGLAPGLVLAAWLNYLKFGSWLPIDYGSSSGNTSLATYWPLIPAIAFALVLALALSNPRVRALCSFRNISMAAGFSLLAVLAVEDMRALLVTFVTGFYVLVVDFQAYEPVTWDAAMFSRTDDGHLLLIGQLKRALLQGLPFIGVLPILILVLREKGSSIYVLFLLAIIFWILPFSLRQWHGGSPQNMRYFLPILPLISVLVAIAFARLYQEARITGRSGQLALLAIGLGTWIAVAFVFIGMQWHERWALNAATWGPLTLAGAIAVAALLVVVVRHPLKCGAARVTMALATAALVWAGMSSFAHDLVVSQVMRKMNAASNQEATKLEDGVLIVTRTAYRFMPQLLRDDSFVAIARVDLTGGRVKVADRGLIEYHLAQGRRVYVDGLIAEEIVPALGAPAFKMAEKSFGQHGLVELRAP